MWTRSFQKSRRVSLSAAHLNLTKMTPVVRKALFQTYEKDVLKNIIKICVPTTQFKKSNITSTI